MVTSRVKLERIRKGLTQQKLAEKTAGIVSQVKLSQIEHGRRTQPDEAAALSTALGIPVSELWPE